MPKKIRYAMSHAAMQALEFKPGDCIEMSAEGRHAFPRERKTGTVERVYFLDLKYIDVRRGQKVDGFHAKFWKKVEK